MDGVLVDSAAAVDRVWRRWARRHGLPFSQVAPLIHGRPSRESVAAILPRANPAEESAWIEAEQVRDTDGVVAIAGAAVLLRDHRPLAVVTSASDELAAARFAAAGLAAPESLVTADRVSRGKPDPEPYLAGAAELGVDPAECVVLEDAPAGIESAHRAGMRAIGVLTTFSEADLRRADALVTDLTEVEAALAAL